MRSGIDFPGPGQVGKLDCSVEAVTDRQALLQDLATAIQNVRASDGGDGNERLRVRYALLEVYRIREQVWVAGLASADNKRYYTAADTRPEWQTVEALVAVHNVDKHGHALAVRVGFEPLYPGENVFPSDYLFPGTNLYWRAWQDLPQDVAEAMRNAIRGGVAERLYRGRLAGRLVLETLWGAHAALAGTGPLG